MYYLKYTAAIKRIPQIMRKRKTQPQTLFVKYFLCIDPLCHPVPQWWRDILKNGIDHYIVTRNHKYGQILLFDGFSECGSEIPLIWNIISKVLARLHQNTSKITWSCGDNVCPKIHFRKNSAWQNTFFPLNTMGY